MAEAVSLIGSYHCNRSGLFVELYRFRHPELSDRLRVRVYPPEGTQALWTFQLGVPPTRDGALNLLAAVATTAIPAAGKSREVKFVPVGPEDHSPADAIEVSLWHAPNTFELIINISEAEITKLTGLVGVSPGTKDKCDVEVTTVGSWRLLLLAL